MSRILNLQGGAVTIQGVRICLGVYDTSAFASLNTVNGAYVLTLTSKISECDASRLQHLEGYPPRPLQRHCSNCEGLGGDTDTVGRGRCPTCRGSGTVRTVANDCLAADNLNHCTHWEDGARCCSCGFPPL